MGLGNIKSGVYKNHAIVPGSILHLITLVVPLLGSYARGYDPTLTIGGTL